MEPRTKKMIHLAWNRKNFAAPRGFSLVELLVVIAILGILLALAAPPISSVMRASGVTNAGDQLMATLSQARQTAIARNRTVEVRLYQYVDPDAAQEPAEGRFRSMQLFLIESITQENGAAPIGRTIHFPGSTYLAPNAALSSLLDSAIRPSVTGTALGHPISPCGLNYRAKTIRFYPDGSTDLPVDRLWYLTIVPANTPETITAVPDNFATIVIQSASGKAQLHRP
jgi:uncharacterized protein (TIGR02596 family)